MKARYLNSWSGFLGFLAFYAACLFLLLPKLSLWLDEILDLREVRDDNFSTLIAHIPRYGGGVPLGYLAQAATVHLLGCSRFSGRLPSALFSLVACASIFILGRRLKLRYPLLSVLIFCSMPLQLRYALESRPYSQALAFTIGGTVAFTYLSETPTTGKAVLYGAITLASLYTQPYTAFVFLAHILWLCCFEVRRNQRRVFLSAGVPVTLAALGFLPWHLWAVHLWSRSAAAQQRYEIGWKTILIILRELVGGGYLGTAIVVAFIFAGFAVGLSNSRERGFWTLYLILPLVLPVLADAGFGYFFAIRQTIFVLAPLALLTALGLERIAQLHPKAAFSAYLLLFAVFLAANIRFFSKPREDWQAASCLLRKLASHGDCLLFMPAGSVDLYRFFKPHLSSGNCLNTAPSFRAIAVAMSPYESKEESANLIKKLAEAGWIRSKELRCQEPKVDLYERSQ